MSVLSAIKLVWPAQASATINVFIVQKVIIMKMVFASLCVKNIASAVMNLAQYVKPGTLNLKTAAVNVPQSVPHVKKNLIFALLVN